MFSLHSLLVCILVNSLLINQVHSFEPITMTIIGGGGGIILSAFYAGWDFLSCSFKECCYAGWQSSNLTKLEHNLKTRLYGQHLVIDMVLKTLRSHTSKTEPEKALVLSFHGLTGSGKSYVSKFIADSLFKEGEKSKFVHSFYGPLHFPFDSEVNTYKIQLQNWIRGYVSQCAYSLFIFEELDKTPPQLFDAIKPFIDYHPHVDNVDFRKSIFLFLNTAGGNLITQKMYDIWKSGRKRESAKRQEFQDILHQSSFNEKGGLYLSDAVASNLVDHYIPFLPLEKKHIKHCVKDAFETSCRKRFGNPKDCVKVTPEMIERVVNEMTYYPEDGEVYSTTGCKHVMQKVDMVIEEMLHDIEDNEL